MAADQNPTTLECPEDIGARLDAYADKLGQEFQFPVTRQQAFERLARTILPAGEVAHG